MASRAERVVTHDGPFDMTVWLPEAGHGPGFLLIQEIYGVSDYIRAVPGRGSSPGKYLRRTLPLG